MTTISVTPAFLLLLLSFKSFLADASSSRKMLEGQGEMYGRGTNRQGDLQVAPSDLGVYSASSHEGQGNDDDEAGDSYVILFGLVGGFLGIGLLYWLWRLHNYCVAQAKSKQEEAAHEDVKDPEKGEEKSATSASTVEETAENTIEDSGNTQQSSLQQPPQEDILPPSPTQPQNRKVDPPTQQPPQVEEDVTIQPPSPTQQQQPQDIKVDRDSGGSSMSKSPSPTQQPPKKDIKVSSPTQQAGGKRSTAPNTRTTMPEMGSSEPALAPEAPGSRRCMRRLMSAPAGQPQDTEINGSGCLPESFAPYDKVVILDPTASHKGNQMFKEMVLKNHYEEYTAAHTEALKSNILSRIVKKTQSKNSLYHNVQASFVQQNAEGRWVIAKDEEARKFTAQIFREERRSSRIVTKVSSWYTCHP